jgi:hypothetical protein
MVSLPFSSDQHHSLEAWDLDANRWRSSPGGREAKIKGGSMRKLILLANLLLWATFALGQTPTGTIEGTVVDPQGASVAGATITALNNSTGISRDVKSDEAGRFVMPFVPPATYTVTVEATGFRPSKQENVVVEVSQTRALPFALKLGTVGQTVEITATAPVLDTQTSSLGEVVQTRTINDLPLNGRDVFALQELTPGVNPTGNMDIPHIGGSRNDVNEQQIDGMTNILPENNVGDNFPAYTPIIDSVQEFSVQISVLPAEYGRFAGGTTSLITKSGGEQFHGSAFEFARNGIFDALSYFSKPNASKADLHRYQTGGTVGGPIPKFKRTFFFFGIQNQQLSQAQQETDNLPQKAWYTGNTAGDFSGLITPGTNCGPSLDFNNPSPAGCIYDPATAHTTKCTDLQKNGGGQVDCTVRNPFPGNIIPSNRLSAVALKMLAFYPAPNAAGNGFNYQIVGQATNNNQQWDTRLDHDFGANWHSFLRLSHLDGHSTPLLDYNNAASQGFDGPQHFSAWSASFNNTVTFTPTLLGEFRYGWSRNATRRTGAGGLFDPTTLGFPAYVAQTAALAGTNGFIFPRLNLDNGYSGLGPQGFNAFSQNPMAHDITGSIVKIAGAHSIKVGAEFRKLYENFYQFGLPTGQYTADSNWTQSIVNNGSASGGTGNPFASILLGLPSGGNTTHDTSVASASSYIAFYGQDDWRATKRLTLNLGLRWDVEIPRTERFNKLDYWDPTKPSPLGVVTPAVGVSCPACSNLRGAMIFTGTSADPFGRRQGPTQKKDFGPRIGFAYDAGHNLAIRGGYGIVFAPSALQAGGSSGGTGNAGFTSGTNFNSSFDNQATFGAGCVNGPATGCGTLDNPYPGGYNLPTKAALGASTNLGSGISDTYFASYRNPYSIEWNFNIQYALPGQTTIEAGYLGNHGLFLVDGDPGKPFDQLPVADLALGKAALEASVPNPFFGLITTPGSAEGNKTIQARYLLRPYPQYDNVISFRHPTAESKYNAFTLRLNKHFSQGLSVLVSFTGSKQTDDSASPVSFQGPQSQTYANQYNPRGEWGLGAQDISRILAIGYTYELPFGHGKPFLNTGGVINRVIGGWQAAGIIALSKGTPIVLSGQGDPTDLFTLGQRPLWNGKSAKLSNPTHAAWFDTSVFSKLTPLTIGNAPRVISNVRVPGVANADLSFFKNNYFGSEDRFNAQFRFEMFNALNHPQWGGPDANVNDGGNFGKITSIANASRQIQLALKFVF